VTPLPRAAVSGQVGSLRAAWSRGCCLRTSPDFVTHASLFERLFQIRGVTRLIRTCVLELGP
jgi:hypothetical protein